MRARIQRFVKPPGPYRQAQAEEIQYRPYLIDGCLARNATAGHDPADVADHRARAPWYASKAQPSTADMAAKLRRVIIA